MKDELREKIDEQIGVPLREAGYTEGVVDNLKHNLLDYITENHIPKDKLLTEDEILDVMNTSIASGYWVLAKAIHKAQEEKITCNKEE